MRPLYARSLTRCSSRCFAQSSAPALGSVAKASWVKVCSTSLLTSTSTRSPRRGASVHGSSRETRHPIARARELAPHVLDRRGGGGRARSDARAPQATTTRTAERAVDRGGRGDARQGRSVAAHRDRIGCVRWPPPGRGEGARGSRCGPQGRHHHRSQGSRKTSPLPRNQGTNGSSRSERSWPWFWPKRSAGNCPALASS